MYQAVKKTREQYEDMVVEVDPKYMDGVTNRVYPKSCFEKSWEYIVNSLHHSGLKLVHGTCMVLGGLAIDHGWIEIGEDIVFEGVYQRFYDKKKYYEARGLVKYVEYTLDEVRKMSWETRHKGPWVTVSNQWNIFTM
jgi:hypothetical protein